MYVGLCPCWRWRILFFTSGDTCKKQNSSPSACIMPTPHTPRFYISLSKQTNTQLDHETWRLHVGASSATQVPHNANIGCLSLDRCQMYRNTTGLDWKGLHPVITLLPLTKLIWKPYDNQQTKYPIYRHPTSKIFNHITIKYPIYHHSTSNIFNHITIKYPIYHYQTCKILN